MGKRVVTTNPTATRPISPMGFIVSSFPTNIVYPKCFLEKSRAEAITISMS